MRKLYGVLLVLFVGGFIQACATTGGMATSTTGLNPTGTTTASPAASAASAGARCTTSTGSAMTGSSVTTTSVEPDISDVIAQSTAPESLETITAQTDIPMVMNEKVQYFINYFSGPEHDIFAKWLERSERYIPQMKRILRDNGLPEDLVYMALIESGFNTHAFSRSRACGPWQFIRSTAQLYHLKVNWWVDERRNPEKSTLAAALYLKNLYDTFGSWYLAEAAYNAGPLKVMWAMQKQKTDNFWKLADHRYLRKETRDYVPKLIAAAMIAKDPAAYGFKDLTYDKPLEDDTVVLHRQIDLHVAARLAHTTYDVIKQLNPELLRWATPPVPDYTLNIPAGTRKLFLADLDKLPRNELFSYKRYMIRKGDTLYMIARAYGVPVHELRVMNHIWDVRALHPGRDIIIPVSPYQHREVVASARRMRVINTSYATPRASSRYIYYRVRQGDTLWNIAQKFDVTISRIKYNNRIRGRLIKPNMILKIPKVIARED